MNPRSLSAWRFSRPLHSASLPFLRLYFKLASLAVKPGAPCRTRTYNQRIRSPLLYPIEPMARKWKLNLASFQGARNALFRKQLPCCSAPTWKRRMLALRVLAWPTRACPARDPVNFISPKSNHVGVL